MFSVPLAVSGLHQESQGRDGSRHHDNAIDNNSVAIPAQASRRKALIGMGALAVGAALPLAALAQSDKPIRFILPVATGSGVDTITRATSVAIAKALGYPVVIDNQPGAGGIVGTSAMVKAAPDGFTLSVVSNNHAIYPIRLDDVFGVTHASKATSGADSCPFPLKSRFPAPETRN